MGGGNFIEVFGNRLAGCGIIDMYDAVNANGFQQGLYASAVELLGWEWEDGLLSVPVPRIFGKKSLRLSVQGNMKCLGHLAFGLIGNVGKRVVGNVLVGEAIEVAHTASRQRLEHKDITHESETGIVGQISIIDFVTLFQGKEERVAMHGIGKGYLPVGIVLRDALADAPLQEDAQHVHRVNDGRIGENLGWMTVYAELRIEVAVLLIMDMLIDEVGSEFQYLLAGDALGIQSIIGNVFYLSLVLLEALQFLVGGSGIDDATLSREMVCEKLLEPLNEGKSFLFPIVILAFMIETGFYNPFQPCAVGFLVKGVHSKRCNGTHKALNTFLLILGNKSGALITGCLVVPKVWVDNNLMSTCLSRTRKPR